MLEKIPGVVLKNRVLITIGIIILIIIGIWSALDLPVDVYPNLNAPVVTVVTEHHGMAPEEIETLITFPLETGFNSLPYVKRVRSSSMLGISLINVEFEYDTDIYKARQLVAEKLQLAAARLPAGVEDPFMGPVSSMFADAVEFTISGHEDLFETRDLAEWTVKPRLQTVQGVSYVVNFGGYLKQYHVLLDPDELFNFDITIKQVIEVLKANNRNFSGGYLIEKSEEKLVRGLGRIKTIEDIENIIITVREGIPVFIKQVADVEIGPFLRRGAASENGEEVIAITVQNQYNANVMETINGTMEEIDRLKEVLGERYNLTVFYTQLDMIVRAMANVKNAIILSAFLVIIVLLAFLGNIRTTVITALTIPLSVIIAFIFMQLFDLSFNIMTMGGLAVGIGMTVDASIIMTENIFRHLQEKRVSHLDAVTSAAREVIRPIFFAMLILLASFAPVFTLQGLEGKMFIPLAIAVSSALFGSLIITMTLTVILCSVILKQGNEKEKHENFLIGFFKKIYNPVLNFSLDHKLLMISIGMVL
ncbi:efflux RND transporter permease subunit, partial [candidate division KSB1 bacterium]